MYAGYLTDVPGIKVGHWQDDSAMTGASVIICDQGAVGGVDVRGSAPGTRETDLFQEKKMMDKINSIVLAGGSAFGLDAASGVMKYLEEENIGFDTGICKVPIVASAVIFDLGLGDPKVRPDFQMGYQAAKLASYQENRQGNVGAGAGASVGKILGPDFTMKAGLGSASVQVGDLVVGALVVVNAMGDVFGLDNKKIAGVYDYKNKNFLDTGSIMKEGYKASLQGRNTTIGVVATNADLNKAQANKLAEMAHNAYARRIFPVHTSYDGDTIFSLATGGVQADINLVGILAIEAMEKAIINAIESAQSYKNFKAFTDL
ncbi:MAG: P1 family peptidase [Bacillota bacterium]|nr:P1 family peptidase [Bacillota bacterium]